MDNPDQLLTALTCATDKIGQEPCFARAEYRTFKGCAMSLPLYVHDQSLYSTALTVTFDWYLIFADKNHFGYIEQIILSTPETYRVAIITDAKIPNSYRWVSEKKKIYLIELDSLDSQNEELQSTIDRFFLPQGTGCIQLKVSSDLIHAIKKNFSEQPFVMCY